MGNIQPVYRAEACKDEVTETDDGQWHNFKYCATSMTGWRASQEDKYICIPRFHKEFNFFGVYDGHGGSAVAEYLKMYLHEYVKDALEENADDVESSLFLAFLKADLAMKDEVDRQSREEYNIPKDPSDTASKEKLKDGIKKYFESHRCTVAALIASSKTIQKLHDEPLQEEDSEDSEDEDFSMPEDEEDMDSSATSSDAEEEEEDEEDMDSSATSSDAEEEEEDEIDDPYEDDAVRMYADAPCTEADDVDKEEKYSPEEKVLEGTDKKSAEDNADKKSNDEEGKDEKTVLKETMHKDKDKDAFLMGNVKNGAPFEGYGDIVIDTEKAGTSNANETTDLNEAPGFFPDSTQIGLNCGSTATVVVFDSDSLYVANVGDSRCVACINGHAVDLSKDHSPEDTEEKERIKAAGAQVTRNGRINGSLNMSRAFGDFSLKGDDSQDPCQALLVHPHVTKIDRNDDLEFVVIASDGIWNSISSEDVIEFFKRTVDVELRDAGTVLMELILPHKETEDGTGCDNMTIIVIKFFHDKKAAYNASCVNTDNEY